MPLFVRKAFVDFVETATAMIFALNFVIPGNLDEAKAQGIVFGGAVLAAAVSAARRAVPAAIAWLKSQMGVSNA